MARARPNFCSQLALCVGPEAVARAKAMLCDWPVRPQWAWKMGPSDDPRFYVQLDEALVVLEVQCEPGTRNTWVKVFNSHMQLGWLRADWLRRVEL